MKHVRRLSRRHFLRTSGRAALTAVVGFGIARRTSAVRARRPNILFFFPDQHRYDWVQWNRAVPVRTPNLAALAREGVRFAMAFCPSPVCAPSRAALTLGQQYGGMPVRGNEDNLPDDAVTIYARLREAGYRVGSVGKLDLHKPAKDWGPDGLHRVAGHAYFSEWGFTDGFDSEGKGDAMSGIKKDETTGKPYGVSPYIRMLAERHDGSLETLIQWWKDRADSGTAVPEYAYTTPMSLADEAYNDNWVGRNGLDLLNAFPAGQPWFLQVNFPGPHVPMDITPGMAGWYKDAEFPGPYGNDQLPPETHTAIRRNYSAMVENIDRWPGRYRETIEARGEHNNTIIVYASDHGDMLGDHNRWAKTVPYQPSVCVPFVVSGPRIRKGVVHTGPVETLDLSATFLDYAGVSVPQEMTSRTLRPFLETMRQLPRTYAFSALKEWRLVCNGRYKLVCGFDPASPGKFAKKGANGNNAPTAKPAQVALLFDLKSDPFEAHNIAEQEPGVLRKMKSLMRKRSELPSRLE